MANQILHKLKYGCRFSSANSLQVTSTTLSINQPLNFANDPNPNKNELFVSVMSSNNWSFQGVEVDRTIYCKLTRIDSTSFLVVEASNQLFTSWDLTNAIIREVEPLYATMPNELVPLHQLNTILATAFGDQTSIPRFQRILGQAFNSNEPTTIQCPENSTILFVSFIDRNGTPYELDYTINGNELTVISSVPLSDITINILYTI